jgi:hypothetical protein
LEEATNISVFTKHNFVNLLEIRNGNGETLGRLKFFNRSTRMFYPEEHRFEKNSLVLRGLLMGMMRMGKKNTLQYFGFLAKTEESI